MCDEAKNSKPHPLVAIIVAGTFRRSSLAQRGGIMNRWLETPEELASGMDGRAPADALLYFVDWLNRRDKLSDKIATDYLATSLEALAAELRAEAIENLNPQTRGLVLAATVLLDAASDTRAGDGPGD